MIALDPETGRELWTFDPQLERGRNYANMWINRGVAYWRDPAASGACAARVFLATLDARLIALDAATGTPCSDFGANGTVDLLAGLAPVHDNWEYNVTSPGAVIGDRIVVGSSIADVLRPDAPPGDVRAFDVRTGALLWTFHTIPHANEPGHETWENGIAHTGAANVWSTITADPARGLVFLPVSTPSPDFYGGERLGANLYSDSVVALDAATGQIRWHYQTVHHDLWDYDLAAPPVLVTLRRGDTPIDAVAQATKHGFVFVLERDTGKPVFPIEEKPFPASDVPGERAWPTQPIPSLPPPLVPQTLTEADLYAPTPEHLAACKAKLATLRNDGLFTPPSETGSILYPFTGGGANWSGATWDPDRQLLVVPVQNLAHVIRLDRVAPHEAGDVKPLHGLSFGTLWWVLTGRGTGERFRLHPSTGRTIFTIDDIPCNAPPWGRLVARRSRQRHHRVERIDAHGGGRRARSFRLRAGALDRQRPGFPRGHARSGAARARRRHGSTHHDVRASGRPARRPDHVQASPRRQAVRRRRARRSRRHRLEARRLRDRVHAARHGARRASGRTLARRLLAPRRVASNVGRSAGR